MVEVLKVVMRGEPLSRETAKAAMQMILKGSARPEQIGAFLTALRFRALQADELVGFVSVLREFATTVPLLSDNTIDICGTGGDGAHTFNISTTSAFVVAACGQPIAKHGNRAVSSRAGSFDLLEALGIGFSGNPEEFADLLENRGIGFLFAPAYHPALKELSGLRRSLGTRTVFNAIGPMLNPAGVKRQIIGVYCSTLVEPMAHALRELGSKEVMVVHGEDGLDELTLGGRTKVAHLKDGKINSYEILPEELGLRRASIEDLVGGDVRKNMQITTDILKGEVGPRRDVVVLNSAAALMVGGKVQNMKQGIDLAGDSIDSGSAYSLLEKLRSKR